MTDTGNAPLTRTSAQNACGSDGANSICFDQADMAFTPGVVAFTRVIATDRIGMQVGSSAVATQMGQILDADIYLNPSGSPTTYATPQALASNRTAYDLESVPTHELGHALGFSHSAVWSAIMFPFAAAPGTFSGMRPTVQQPDAPLGEDDRAGLRVLYANPADALHPGSIRGQIFPPNPLALPASPPGVTGVLTRKSSPWMWPAAQSRVRRWADGVARGRGPVQFDGNYEIDGLAVGHSYVVYAEALNGAVDSSSIANAIVTLCRNAMTDPGWPPLQGSVVPAVNTSFTTRMRPGP